MSIINSSSSKLWQRCTLVNAEYVMALSIPPQMYYINYVIATICNIFLIALAVVLNATSIIAYWRSTRLRKKTSYFLVMLLSVNHLTTSLVGHPVFVLHLVLILRGNGSCTLFLLHEILTFSVAGMSFGSVLALNIERYLGIAHPIFHRTKITKIKMLAIIVLFWLVCGSAVLAYLILGPQVAHPMTSFIICAHLVITVYIYMYICLKVKRIAGSPLRANEGQSQNMRMTTSCAIVVACTIISYLPFAVTRPLEVSTFVHMLSIVWSKTLTLTLASVDPLVFFWYNSTLRNEAKALFKSKS